MVDFPNSLPSPTINPLSLILDNPVRRTQFDEGFARQRQRFSIAPTRISVRFIFDYTQRGIFESWFQRRISWGADFFAIDLPTSFGIEKHQARFLNTPTINHIGFGSWEITAELEIIARSPLDPDALDILALLPEAGAIERLADKLHTLIHDTIPNRIPL